MMAPPRIVIAGTHSGVGKTTIATALMAAYTRRGLRVQPFKVGPDFIDPGFHTVACGRASRNLDGWMLSREANRETFARASADADLAIVEGVMGLFDGAGSSGDAGTTAQIAKWLKAPVVLVIDASAMSQSAAAVVHGFESFDRKLDVAGVIANRVAGERHAEWVREAIAGHCRAVALGFLPADARVAMPERHLGLVMAREALTAAALDEMAALVEAHVDLDRLLALAQSRSQALPAVAAKRAAKRTAVRIAVARDAAFCFYYEDNLDALRAAGAELVEFSPIADPALPDGVSGVYLGGGYPELHAERLAANGGMRGAIARFSEADAPIYAECGGFMYLTEAIVDTAGREHAMAGVFPTRAVMQKRLARLGYTEIETLWGQRARGHEFRYSTTEAMPEEVERAYREPNEGYRVRNTLASYVHLHFSSCPQFAGNFIHQCVRWDAERQTGN